MLKTLFDTTVITHGANCNLLNLVNTYSPWAQLERDKLTGYTFYLSHRRGDFFCGTSIDNIECTLWSPLSLWRRQLPKTKGNQLPARFDRLNRHPLRDTRIQLGWRRGWIPSEFDQLSRGWKIPSLISFDLRHTSQKDRFTWTNRPLSASSEMGKETLNCKLKRLEQWWS